MMYNQRMVQSDNELRRLVLEVQSALIEELPIAVDVELSKLAVYDGLGYTIKLSAAIPGRAHPNHTYILVEVKIGLDGLFRPSSPFYRIKHKRGRMVTTLKAMSNRLDSPTDTQELVKLLKLNMYRIGVRT